MSQGVHVLGGKCPGGKCLGGKCPEGICPWGKCPGGTCPGGLCPRTIISIKGHKLPVLPPVPILYFPSVSGPVSIDSILTPLKETQEQQQLSCTVCCCPSSVHTLTIAPPQSPCCQYGLDRDRCHGPIAGWLDHWVTSHISPLSSVLSVLRHCLAPRLRSVGSNPHYGSHTQDAIQPVLGGSEFIIHTISTLNIKIKHIFCEQFYLSWMYNLPLGRRFVVTQRIYQYVSDFETWR